MQIQSEFVVRTAAAIAAVVVSLSMVACGSGSSGDENGPVDRADSKLYTDAPSSGCGSQPTPVAIDPDGVVKSLPKDQQVAYESFPAPNLKSSWSNFKPKHDPPYTVGLNLVPSANDFMTRINRTLAKSLKASPEVGRVVTMTSQTINDVVGQLSNFDALLREKPDIILTVAIQPIPYAQAVDRAAKQGIPVVSFLAPVPSKNSLNVQYNVYEATARSTATLLRLIGGKGNVFWVNGIPGDIATDVGRKAYTDTIKRCPDVKDIGQVFGSYVNSIAKRETLTFLATHPQKVAAVAQAASMGTGIMQAFQQSGRPMPVVQDAGGQQGSLGYWRQHPDYAGTGFGVPPSPTARTAVNVALRTLEGQGPKLNNLVSLAPPITPANLDEWAEPGWTLSSLGTADGPDQMIMSNDYMDTLFARGAPPK